MKAFKRLIYTISNQNKPNQTDADALNELIEYKNKEDERTINNHRMFAKVYTAFLTSEIIRTKGNYQLSTDSVRMHLKLSLETAYNTLVYEINTQEFNKLSDQLGLTDGDTVKEDDKNREIIKENAEILSKVLHHFDREKIIDRLNTVIIKLIEDYENKR